MTQPGGGRTYFQNVHRFRGIAIFFVLATHAAYGLPWIEVSPAVQLVEPAMQQSSLWFAFVSGFLFLHLAHRYDTRSYYKSKLKNVILPYVVCSIPALLASVTFFKDNIPAPFVDFDALTQMVLMFLTGSHMAQFWYIPTITLIFLIGPLLLKLERAGYLLWLLPLLVLWAFLMGRDGVQHTLGGGLYNGPLSKAVYILPCYVSGMLGYRYYDQLRDWVSRYWLPWMAVAVAALAMQFDADAPVHWIFAWKFLSAMPLVVALERLPSRGWTRILDELGTYSFGIFFLHGYFLVSIALALKAYPPAYNWAMQHSILYVAYVAAACAGCFACLAVARKVLGRSSRMVVGA